MVAFVRVGRELLPNEELSAEHARPSIFHTFSSPFFFFRCSEIRQQLQLVPQQEASLPLPGAAPLGSIGTYFLIRFILFSFAGFVKLLTPSTVHERKAVNTSLHSYTVKRDERQSLLLRQVQHGYQTKARRTV